MRSISKASAHGEKCKRIPPSKARSGWSGRNARRTNFPESGTPENCRLVGVAAQFRVELGGWYDEPAGPHPKAMFQVAFDRDQFGPVVMWLMLNRDGLSILVHPRTGDEVADHSSNPLWLGEQLAIDLDVLRAYLAASADRVSA